ncbi:glycoside hydrolase family 1 protein [Microbacterium sp. TNHR37B]|uniref:glycoside hydrolase family 1 protein n=1 Tax=Microbacterium sp. TNHR37B TaxID=1775956 RepID=UPI0007B18015|nr:family 1 glycosylhydrolase [Microbacterium sp. TNHR37B]KZE88523.1 Beta-glucosidase [Microbacterium sp. TNHR37B]
MTTLAFPDGFAWGAATAGHQIEGGNVNSDWWPREVAADSPLAEPSGDAADSYHRYREDISLLAASGLNTYRFSLEWSRIEPAEGMVSHAALDHYRRVIDCCLELGVDPAITIYHFTTPQWFAVDGGWRHPASVDRFVRFVEIVLPLLHAASHVFTINEPNILAMIFAGKGNQQIQAGALPEPDPVVTEHVIAAHRRAVELVRTTGRPVGWPVAPQQFFADPGAEEVLRAYAYPRETVFLEASRGDDFVGVQAYTRTRVTKDGPLPAPDDVEQTLTGWEYYPPAIAEAARLAHDVTGLPVYVSENGIATADDARRIDYTRDALRALHAEMTAGLPLIGYLHWSLLDNYEWGSYTPTFGLIAWERETFVRRPKPSLAWLGGVARDNALRID